MKKFNVSNIEGYEQFDKYEVTSDGKVISNHRKNPIQLKSSLAGSGYPMVSLSSNGKTKYEYVHKLVLLAFGELPKDYLDKNYECNHINEIKTDNHISNLEWLTHIDNINHGNRTNKCIAKLSKPVAMINYDNEIVNIYKSITDTEKDNFCISHVSNVCNGKAKTHKGYKWQFVKDLDEDMEVA